ncbi:MAG: NAD+ synthase [Anaerolineales bacterium]|jgi:NAD+ synthase
MDKIQERLKINTDLAQSILTSFIRIEIERAGFKHAVLGISGGVDSALSCFLTARALGPENVLALHMPYETTPDTATEHAMQVIDITGVQHKSIEIAPFVNPIFERLSEADRIRQGNIMARMRMILLYDQSVDFEALVVGTSNKTEILLGYTTLYGDNACAINPLGDLYKTQIWQLARALEVPEEIVEKAPSADLWVGQTDEGELGFTYARVDQLLYLLVDQRYSPEACVEAGFDKDFVHEVVRKIQRTQYKRMLPPIAKLSNRTIGYDFLYLRDWGT